MVFCSGFCGTLLIWNVPGEIRNRFETSYRVYHHYYYPDFYTSGLNEINEKAETGSLNKIRNASKKLKTIWRHFFMECQQRRYLKPIVHQDLCLLR